MHWRVFDLRHAAGHRGQVELWVAFTAKSRDITGVLNITLGKAAILLLNIA